MDLKDKLKLWLPCDEESGSTLFDHVNRNDFEYANIGRGIGQMPGKSVVFNSGSSVVHNMHDLIDYSGSFTCHFWFKNLKTIAAGNELLEVAIDFVTTLEVIEKQINVGYGQWHCIDLVYDHALQRISIMMDGSVIERFSIAAYPAITSVAFNDALYFPQLGICEVDDIRIYEYALVDADVVSLFNYKYNPVKYFMDGLDLSSYGLIVSGHNGLVSLPVMKDPLKVDWPDFHGEMVDLSDPTYGAREITFNCWIKADDRFEFFDKMNRFIKDILFKPGTRQLIVDIHPTKPLIYYVYCPGGFDVARQTKYNNANQVGKFDLKLREPDPFKRILKHVATVINSTSNVAFHSEKMATIYWGDGEKSTGNGDINITHTYALAGEYYITIVGNIEEIIAFTTTAIPVWTLL